MTPDETGEAAALAAAQTVAREHGVACDEAVLIAAGSNALVHLKPAPVVARVMTGTAVLHDDVEQWLSREMAVAAFLAERTDLAVAPSDILPPGPHEQDGLWMTLWRFVSHDAQAAPPEPRELGRSLRELHAALADFPGDLAPLSDIGDWLGSLIAQLRPSPSLTERDIDWLGSKLDALTPAVFQSPLPAQALHGDASVGNLLRTDSGLIWNDLEDVCHGPVAWDICGLVMSARARGHSAMVAEELLAAYGDPGVGDLEAFFEAHALYEVVWHAYEGRRRPRAMKRAAARLALWRDGCAGRQAAPPRVRRSSMIEPMTPLESSISVVPANHASCDDLQAVFGMRGTAAWCQCQRYKLRPREAFRSFPVEERARRLREQTECGHPESETTSGLVAYLEQEAVGWCAVEPRPRYEGLLRVFRVPWDGRDEDKTDDTVWAVTCLLARAGFRKQGVSRALARAAVAFARERGARAIEAYPIIPENVIAEELHVGTPSVFADAGLVEVSRPTLRRLVMRLDF